MMCKLLLLLALILASCEKTVTFDLQKTAPKLVVEGTIENGQAPVVVLSTSLDYFSNIDLASVAKSFVHEARVFVSNGLMTHQLKEYTKPGPLGNNFYYYSNDSASLATAFEGKLNADYSLRIEWEGNVYTSSTHIPFTTRRIDSLFWKPAPQGVDTNFVSLVLRATDAPGLGDYIRYVTKRNSEPFYPGLNSVFDDQVIDGQTYELEVDRGVDRNETRPDTYIFFSRGDTVTLKLSNIDKATFDFWRTMEYTYSSIGNPFSSPTKVIGNISNGALGYFGGYGSQYKTIIIPK